VYVLQKPLTTTDTTVTKDVYLHWYTVVYFVSVVVRSLFEERIFVRTGATKYAESEVSDFGQRLETLDSGVVLISPFLSP
jgi:hypothetical protein